MHPAVVLLADIRNRVDIIEGSQHSGAGSGVHKEWNVTLGLALQDQALQLRGDHLAVLIRWHHNAVIGAQSTNGSA